MTLPDNAQDLSGGIFNDLFFQHYYPSIITPATFPAKSECLLLLLEEHHHLLWLYDNLLRHELSACDFSAVTVSVWNWLRQFIRLRSQPWHRLSTRLWRNQHPFSKSIDQFCRIPIPFATQKYLLSAASLLDIGSDVTAKSAIGAQASGASLT